MTCILCFIFVVWLVSVERIIAFGLRGWKVKFAWLAKSEYSKVGLGAVTTIVATVKLGSEAIGHDEKKGEGQKK